MNPLETAANRPPPGATERTGEWLDVMAACEQFLLAGLRREIGPDGDLQAAYRRWYAAQMEEHRRTTVHLMEEFARRTL
jgi:hypothetical protein